MQPFLYNQDISFEYFVILLLRRDPFLNNLNVSTTQFTNKQADSTPISEWSFGYDPPLDLIY